MKSILTSKEGVLNVRYYTKYYSDGWGKDLWKNHKYISSEFW